MNEFWLNTLEFFGLAWWIEIETETPSCVYYFGPYVSAAEAEFGKSGFMQDLQQEGAKGMKVEIKRIKPDQLTIFDDSEAGAGQSGSLEISPVLTGRV